MRTHIAEGVFFTSPGALPRGRHNLTRDEVLTAQRERLMIAVTELMAQGGYRGIGVRDIAAHARISQAAFYECYADKGECVFAAYDRFIALLLHRVAAAIGDDAPWDAMIRRVIRAYLATLDEDLVVARAFQVEMDALGRPARDRRREALVGIAMVLKAERERLWPEAPAVADSAYVGGVYAVRQLASDALDEQASPRLADLTEELAVWVSDLFNPTVVESAP